MMQNTSDLRHAAPGKALLAIGLLASLLLSACGSEPLRSDGAANTDSSLSDTTDASLSKSGAIIQRSGSTTNKPPVISGAAATTAEVGAAWSFTPAASDPEGARLLFTVANKPAWMTFNTLTGALSGTPKAADVRSWANVTISVTDGRTAASLSPFTVAVKAATTAAAAPTLADATVSWVPPSTNEDASPLTDLAGYRVYFGKAANALDQIVRVTNPAATQQIIDKLTSGTWYFAVTALSSTGVESALSNVASKSVP